MTLADNPALGRIAALGILALAIALFCIGPLAAYSGWVGDNREALATKAALLQRYRALDGAGPNLPAPAATGSPLAYPDIPESQASALLQETVKNTAATAHVQVQGLQVLRGEPVSGATRIGVRVRGSGDMASLRAFIYAIENARPLLYPDTLSIQVRTNSADAAAPPLDFQLDISGFKTEPQP